MRSATCSLHSVAARRHHAAGQRLAHAHDVGRDARVVAAEQLSAAAEAGGDLVEDQQHVMLVAQRAQLTQVLGMVEAHAAGALHDGLDDHRRQLVRMLLERAGHAVDARARPGLVETLALARSANSCSVSAPAKQAVHAVRPGRTPPSRRRCRRGSRRARSAGAVFAGAPVRGQYWSASLIATSTETEPESHKNTRVSGCRRELHQLLAQQHGRLVGQPAEHHVAHAARAVRRAPR